MVRGIAIGVALAFACTNPITCIASGAALGAGLRALSQRVNHHKESLAKHMVSGAVEGGLNGAKGIGFARISDRQGLFRTKGLIPKVKPS